MTFEELFEGTFENEQQAKSGSQWSWIVITHKKIDVDTFECTQAYKFDEENPYKKYIVKFVYDGKKVYARNYDSDMNYRQDCDFVFIQENEGSWYGKNSCNTCWVDVGNIRAYQISDIRMGEGYYHIIDIGVNPVNKDIVWGSKYGHMKFKKMPL